MRKTLILLFAALMALPALADDPVLALTADGVSVDVPNLGRFVLAPPILLMTTTDFEGQKPNVSFEDDSTLLAKYPNGIEMRIKIDATTKSAQYTMTSAPTGAYAMRFDMLIPTNLQAKCGFDKQALIDLPATSMGQFVLKGQTATQFNLANKTGTGLAIITPTAWHDLQDNRKFNWDTFQYHYFYDLARYPDQTHFEIRFDSYPATSTPTQ